MYENYSSDKNNYYNSIEGDNYSDKDYRVGSSLGVGGTADDIDNSLPNMSNNNNNNNNNLNIQRIQNNRESIMPSSFVVNELFGETDDNIGVKSSNLGQNVTISTTATSKLTKELENFSNINFNSDNNTNNTNQNFNSKNILVEFFNNNNMNSELLLSSKMKNNENIPLATTTTSRTNYSITNNLIDIFKNNDENILNNKMLINDTLINDLGNNDIVVTSSTTINPTGIIIDNLLNSSSSSSSFGVIDNINIGNNFTLLLNSTSDINTTPISSILSTSLISSTSSSSSSSIEIDISYTPSMSQVLLAPTITSFINYQIPTDATYVAMGSIVNGGGSGNSITSNNKNIINGLLPTETNATDSVINSFYFYEIQFTVLWILFTVIVLGNTAVLLTLFMNKNRKSRMNFFIKQLAIADLFVGLLNVLTDIIWRLTITWRAGNTACKIIRFSECWITYASTYVLVALSIDRYDAITHPMNFSGSWQRARRLVILAWIVSAIFSIPILFLYEEAVIQGQLQCWIDLGLAWRWKLYMSLISITLFFIPTIIISACYAIIIRTIWVKGSVFVPAERPGRNSTCMASRRASSRGIIPRAKVKTVKMTFVIVIVFVMCWSPYFLYNLWEVFAQPPKTQKSIAISTFIQSLAPLNSAANPLIYCLFSTQVCRALKRVPPFRWLSCLSCCNNPTNNNSTQHRCTTVNQRLHNSCDSMRTLTTSLNVSRRSNNCMRPARVVIVERPKTILAMSEV